MMRRRPLLFAVAAVLAGVQLPAASAKTGNFDAVVHEDDGTHAVGTLLLGADAHLTVLSASDDRRAWLQGLVDRMNAKTTLHEDAISPPEAPRGALVSTPIASQTRGLRTR